MSPHRSKRLVWLASAVIVGVALVGVANRLLEPLSLATVTRERSAASARPRAVEPALAEPAATENRPPTLVADSDATRSSAAGSEHELVLRFADGRPVVAATVAAFDGERVLDRAESDGAGRVRLATPSARVQLLIAGPALVPTFRVVELTSEPVAVELADGVLAGVLRPLDARLDRRVSLEVVSDRPWFVADGLGDAVRHAVPEAWLDPVRLTVQADVDGHFRLEGLSKSWSGSLHVGPECTLYAADPPLEVGLRNRARLGELRADLGLDVFQRPRLVGRVVERAGGPGLGGVSVVLLVRYAVTAGSQSIDADDPYLRARTEDDGSFGVWLPEQLRVEDDARPSWPALEQIAVRLVDVGRNARREFVLPASELRASFDLGELALAPDARERVEFRVHDVSGAGIAGAEVRWGERSATTDDGGRVRLAREVSATSSAQVAAAGYRTARIEVPADVERAIDVALERTSLARVRIVESDGRPAGGLQVAVDDPNARAASSRSVAHRFDAEADHGHVAHALRSLTTDANGEVVLDGLTPGAQVELVALGAFGDELQRFPLVVAAGEHARFEFALAEPLARLRGLVTDAEQQPLNDVLITALRDGTALDRRSGVDGTFAIDHVTRGGLRFGFQKPGFAPVFGEERSVESSTASFHFRLLASRPLHVHAEDTSGRAVPLEALRIAWATAPETSLQRLPASGYWMPAAPSEPASVEVCIAGARYRRALGASERELVFAVPDHGRVQFGLQFASADERVAWTERGASLSVLVRDVEGALEPQRAYFAFGTTDVSLERLLPGDYEACFECGDALDAYGAYGPRSSPGGPARAPVRFRVRANETTDVALAP